MPTTATRPAASSAPTTSNPASVARANTGNAARNAKKDFRIGCPYAEKSATTGLCSVLGTKSCRGSAMTMRVVASSLSMFSIRWSATARSLAFGYRRFGCFASAFSTIESSSFGRDGRRWLGGTGWRTT